MLSYIDFRWFLHTFIWLLRRCECACSTRRPPGALVQAPPWPVHQ